MFIITPKVIKPASKEIDKLSTIPNLHFNVPEMPMQFISMDLIGEFHHKSSAGNAYVLTVICMLTGYTFCVIIKTKTASEVVQAHIDNVYCKFGGSSCIFIRQWN